MRSRRIRPVSWSTSYLLRSPLGISTSTSNSSTSSSTTRQTAEWPGPGTPTSLPHNGRKRAVGRGMGWGDVTDATARPRSGAGSRSSLRAGRSWPAPARRTGSTSAHRWFGRRPRRPIRRPSRRRSPPPPGLDAAAAAEPAAGRRAADGTGRARRPRCGARWRRSSTTTTSAAACSRWSPTLDGRARPSYSERHRRGDPRVHDQAAHRDRRARVARPGPHFETRVVAGGARRIVLVGGGDPLLAREPPAETAPSPTAPTSSTLARQTAAALRDRAARGCPLGYDDTPVHRPGGQPALARRLRARRRGLADHRAVGRRGPAARPASAGSPTRPRPPPTEFADRARRGGHQGRRARPTRGTRAPAAAELAAVEQRPARPDRRAHPRVSDNEAAEVLARHVGARRPDDGQLRRPARRRARRPCAGLGVRHRRGAVIYDGSGLSRENRLAPSTLVDVLRVAARRASPSCGAVLTGLPVAGFTGSLERPVRRGGRRQGRGRVRAKTGTLTGVSSPRRHRHRPGRHADGVRADRRPGRAAGHPRRRGRPSTTLAAALARLPLLRSRDRRRPSCRLARTGRRHERLAWSTGTSRSPWARGSPARART